MPLLPRPRRVQQSLIVTEFTEQRVYLVVHADDVFVSQRHGRGFETALLSHGRNALEITEVSAERRGQRIDAVPRLGVEVREIPQTREIALRGCPGGLESLEVFGAATQQIVALSNPGSVDARAKHLHLFEHSFGIASVARRQRELAKAHVRQCPDQRDRDNAGTEIETDLLVECERHVNQPALDNEEGRDQADRIVMVR